MTYIYVYICLILLASIQHMPHSSTQIEIMIHLRTNFNENDKEKILHKNLARGRKFVDYKKIKRQHSKS